jgi:hypothetical protein
LSSAGLGAIAEASVSGTVGQADKYRIEVNNDIISVALNGTDTAQYTIPDPATVHFPLPWDQRRSRYGATEPTFIGLQSCSNYSYATAFRNIRATVL